MRGRPKNARPEETARTILAAATKLFAEHGYKGASIRGIADGANVSVGTVQHHFGTKGELYDACIASMYEELYTIVDEVDGIVDKPTAELLADGARLGFRFAHEHQMAIRLINRSIMERGYLEEKVAGEFAVPMLDVAATLLADRTGGKASDYLLRIQSSIFLIVRYAIVTDAEAGRLVHRQTADPWKLIEDHLAEVIPALILGPEF